MRPTCALSCVKWPRWPGAAGATVAPSPSPAAAVAPLTPWFKFNSISTPAFNQSQKSTHHRWLIDAHFKLAVIIKRLLARFPKWEVKWDRAPSKRPKRANRSVDEAVPHTFDLWWIWHTRPRSPISSLRRLALDGPRRAAAVGPPSETPGGGLAPGRRPWPVARAAPGGRMGIASSAISGAPSQTAN